MESKASALEAVIESKTLAWRPTFLQLWYVWSPKLQLWKPSESPKPWHGVQSFSFGNRHRVQNVGMAPNASSALVCMESKASALETVRESKTLAWSPKLQLWKPSESPKPWHGVQSFSFGNPHRVQNLGMESKASALETVIESKTLAWSPKLQLWKPSETPKPWHGVQSFSFGSRHKVQNFGMAPNASALETVRESKTLAWRTTLLQLWYVWSPKLQLWKPSESPKPWHGVQSFSFGNRQRVQNLGMESKASALETVIESKTLAWSPKLKLWIP
jgi:hypothetical protein